MDKAFLPLAISFIIGILLANQFQINNYFIFIGLGICLLTLAFSIIRNRKSIFNILAIFILLGIVATNLKLDSDLLKYMDTRGEFVGIVEEVLISNDDISRYIVKVEGNIDSGEELNDRIRLNVIGEKSLNYGERVVFNGLLKTPSDNTNPMLYNYRLNLLSNNIYASMTINDYSLEILNTRVEFPYGLKSQFHERINRVFNENLHEANSSIIKSMILGDSSYLMDEELQIYRDLGLGHILAVSGLHIGIISAFILNILMKLTISRKTSSIITIAILFIYGYLIGFPHSMMRGIIMFSMIIMTKLLYEHSNPINVLSLSALIVLFINPFALFGIGFILSYTAVLSLYLFTKRIEIIFYPYKGYISSTLSAILAVNLGLLPIQAYYFNYVSILGIFANLINIPILSFSLILSVSMFLIDFIGPFLIPGFSILLNILLDFERAIRALLHRFSFLNFSVASPSLDMLIVYYLGVAIMLRVINVSSLKMNIKKTILVFACLILVFNCLNIAFDRTLELHFIDVGQGDSLLIRNKDKDILIDTGGSLLSNYVGEQITLPYLQKLGVNKLHALIISHFDADHAGALAILIDKIEIENLYGSYIPEDEIILDKIKDNEIPFRLLKEGDKLQIEENLTFHTLWPGDTKGLSNNNKSLVLSFNYDEYEILLTGDIEKEAELSILDKIPADIDLLKVAHHGSHTSTTAEFLQASRPKNSIISLGRNNQFNHPSDGVIDRLNEIASRVYRTDEMGLVKVQINKDFKIEAFLEGKGGNIVEFIYENKWKIIFYLFYYIITKKLIIHYKKSGADIYELY